MKILKPYIIGSHSLRQIEGKVIYVGVTQVEVNPNKSVYCRLGVDTALNDWFFPPKGCLRESQEMGHLTCSWSEKSRKKCQRVLIAFMNLGTIRSTIMQII